jgi:hypothetical protein
MCSQATTTLLAGFCSLLSLSRVIGKADHDDSGYRLSKTSGEGIGAFDLAFGEERTRSGELLVNVERYHN